MNTNTKISILPSLLILSGMWWTVCSLTQELVNICSSMEVKEEVLKPKGKLWEQLLYIEKEHVPY